METRFYYIAFLLLLAVASAGRDYYEVLGVSRDSTKKGIRRAYRELSLKWHPDKNPDDPAAEDKFIEIAQAYEVLSNKEKREIYDKFGEEGLKQENEQPQHNPFDIFNMFGGGGSGFQFNFGGQNRGNRGSHIQMGPELIIPFPVTLEELYSGKITELSIGRQKICPKCQGSGAKSKADVAKCNHCHGTGMISKRVQIGPGFFQQSQMPCPHCGGTGETIKRKCPHCKGHKVIVGSDVVPVSIERGMRDGQHITFAGMTDETPKIKANNLKLQIVTLPHPVFVREGDNLRTKLKITLLQALTGFQTKIKHLDDHYVTIDRSQVTKPNQVIRIPSEGMPHHNRASRRGDMLLDVEVVFPDTLTDEQQAQIKSILE
ncbi:hypothetical protein PCE1_002837 [Barthelona sp. PCE]